MKIPPIERTKEKSVAALAGVATDSKETKQANDNQEQSGESIPSPAMFNGLQSQYLKAGFGLYPLTGDSLLVTAPGMGMHRVLPDMRAAKIFLRMMGGVHG